ncbi:hypothetical protein EK21DRAFT_116568 [Setomelanomma holmii]|uniref:Uncharacterized protein n=1 Tax=Setomelanomma holmii TaxID=210430 RepID=A0A9P4LHQ1_9PLEO|nr:hypothetical protein EK21DRAFT_116568 [Setomelanomma holmii]
MYTKTAIILIIGSLSVAFAAPAPAPAEAGANIQAREVLIQRQENSHLCTGWRQDNIGGGFCQWYCNNNEKCLGANARGTGCGPL